MKKFNLTEQHLKLIKNMYFEFDNGAYFGSPCVNIKRPYGNSDVLIDIAEILNIEYDEEYLTKLHKETATALQIIACNLSFEIGCYQMQCEYDDTSWRKI